jgi:hypothetical protein
MPLALILCLAHLLGGGAAAAEPRGSVAIELFTSQGCSSCPPGDAVFDQLWRAGDLDEEAVVLAWHVDYWDRLGWRDPFSSPEASERQRAYARRLRLDRIYTPMMVVNGASAEVTPGREAEVRRTLEAARLAPLGSLEVSGQLPRAGGSSLQVEVAAQLDRRAPAPRVLVRVLVHESGLATPVPLGENRGRTLADSWVVRASRDAMELPPMPEAKHKRVLRIPLSEDWDATRLGLAALLLDPTTGRILQARRGRLRQGP